MRVSHGNGSNLHDFSAELQRLNHFVAVAHKRNLRRVEDRRAHIHGDPPIVFQVRRDQSAFGFHDDPALAGEFLVMHEPHKAARAIAALLHFAAIGVEDAIAEIGIVALRLFHQQYLVAADAEVAVGNETDLIGRQGNRLAYTVDHHEIVACAVHFCKF